MLRNICIKSLFNPPAFLLLSLVHCHLKSTLHSLFTTDLSHPHTLVYTHTNICTHTHTYALTKAHTHTISITHTCTHTRTHMHIHKHTHTSVWWTLRKYFILVLCLTLKRTKGRSNIRVKQIFFHQSLNPQFLLSVADDRHKKAK